MSVAHPLRLVAAIALAAVFLALAHAAARRARAGALLYSDLAFLERAVVPRLDPGLVLAIAAALGILMLGGALAGVRVVAPVPVGAAVVLCVDTSGSMRAGDVAPSRSAAAENAVRAFVDDAPAATRIGIVAFAGSAGVVQPLTAQKDVLRDAIAQIPAPNGGTAIGDALEAAARLLPARGRRAIVLMTDGVNNAGADPLAAAQRIGAAGVEIDTVGIGTSDSGLLIPGTAEPATIDEEALRAVAASGHGAYARVADAASLRRRLTSLAATTTRERHVVDVSLPLAVAGSGVAILALAGGMLAGRFP